MKTSLILLLLCSAYCLAAQTPELVIPTGHSSGILSFSESKAGGYILTVGGDNLIKLWSAEGKELRTYKSNDRAYNQAEISPDASKIAALSDYPPDSSLYILDVMTGKELFYLQIHQGSINQFKFSPDSRFLATASEDHTVVLWSTSTGKALFHLKHHAAEVKKVCFSPDGKTLASFSQDGKLCLWDCTTGRLTFDFQTDVQSFFRTSNFQFSADGKLLVLPGMVNNCDIFDLKSKKIAYNVKGYSGCFSGDGQYFCLLNYDDAVIYKTKNLNGNPLDSLKVDLGEYNGPPMICSMEAIFLSNGKRLLLDNYGSTEVHEVLSGRRLFDLKAHSEVVQSACFSPDVSRCLVSAGEVVRELQFAPGKPWKTLKGHTEMVENSQYTCDGRHIISVAQDFTARVWDAETGRQKFAVKGDVTGWPIPGFVSQLALAPDGQSFVKLTPAPVRWGVKDTVVLDTFAGLTQRGFSPKIAISPDGKLMAYFDDNSMAIQLWDFKKNMALEPIADIPEAISCLTFSADSKTLTAGCYRGGDIWFWNAETRQKTFEVTGTGRAVNHISYSPDLKQFAVASFENTIIMYDAVSKTVLRELAGHTDWVNTVNFSADSRWIISTSGDRTVRIWSADNGKEVAKIVFFGAEDWAITTPEGLFDASPNAMQEMYFVVENEPLELDQLKKRYYEPGLLQKLLGYSDVPLRSVGAFANLPLYPRIKAEIIHDLLKIQLSPRNGGLGKLSLFINGKEVQEDINPKRAKALSVNLREYMRFYRYDTTNSVSLRAYNKAGWLKSKAYTLEYSLVSSKGSSDGSSSMPLPGKTRPGLFAIVVGTSNYSGEKLDLRYPDLDAVAVGEAFTNAGKALFDEKVQIQVLNTSNAPSIPLASKENIRAAFKSLETRAKSGDILLLYLSGHGVNYGTAENSQFYYLTKDVASEDLSDPEIREKYAISTNELTTWLTAIPALKQVMILDACNSGKVVEDLAKLGKKDLSAAQIIAFDRMKDRTGMFILTGSAANKVSYEASQYGQGLLTYSILQGMASKMGRVDVSTLFQYSRDKVPELAKGVGGIQVPILAFPTGGGSFDIGLVTKDVKIPVAQVKPVFIRNNFQEESSFDDVLGLNEALTDYFEGLTAKGAQADIVFVDAATYENAYSIKGRYRMEGETVTVDGKLYKGKTAQGAFQVTGKKTDVPALAEALLEKVRAMIQ